MKTTTEINFTSAAQPAPIKTNNNSSLSVKGLCLLIISVMFGAQQGICQKTITFDKGNFGIAISSMVATSDYGTLYLPAVSYKRKRSKYFVAPIIQKRNLHFSGVQVNYEYSLVEEGQADAKGLELFCFISGAYQNDAFFGKRALNDERKLNPEYDGDASQLKFKSVEAYGGFGLRIRLCKNVKWVNSIGAGGYASIDFPEHLYYASHNFGLMLKTGIAIDFKK